MVCLRSPAKGDRGGGLNEEEGEDEEIVRETGRDREDRSKNGRRRGKKRRAKKRLN